MAYEFRALTTAVETDLLSTIAKLVEVAGDATLLTQDLGEPPHRWACCQIVRPSTGDRLTVEVHAADDVQFADEVRYLSDLKSAPDLGWVQAYWIFTLSGPSEALAIDLAQTLAARQRAVFCDDVSGFDLRLT